MITIDMSKKNVGVRVNDRMFSIDNGILTLQITVMDGAAAYDLTDKTITAIFDKTGYETQPLTPVDGVINIPITNDMIEVGENIFRLNFRWSTSSFEQSPSMTWFIMAGVGGKITFESVNIVGYLISELNQLKNYASTAEAGAETATEQAGIATEQAGISTDKANEVKDLITKTPYVGANGHWYEWDIATSQYADTGVAAKGDKGDTFTYVDLTPENKADLVSNAASAWDPEFEAKYAELETEYASDLTEVKTGLAQKAYQTALDTTNVNVANLDANKANKSEVTNVMTPKGNLAYASLPTTGNIIGWYYYCSDGDGTHGKGNYVWNGTAWYFGGTGDEGYSIVNNKVTEHANVLPTVISKNLYKPSELMVGYYIAGATGVITPDSATNAVSGKIYIDIGKTVYFSRNGVAQTVTRVAWYDANNNFIVKQDNVNNTTVVNGASYFRIFAATTMFNDSFQIENDGVTAYEAYFAPYFIKCASDASLNAIDSKYASEVERINSELYDGVPSYWETEVASSIENINANIQNVGKNGETFLFFTDVHWEKNEKHSPSIIKRILRETGIKTVVCGGDILTNGTKSYAMPYALDFKKSMYDISYLFAFGNHDSNAFDYTADLTSADAIANVLTTKNIYGIFEYQLSDDTSITWQDSTGALDLRYGSSADYYIDKKSSKTRYIVLNSGLFGWGQETSKAFTRTSVESMPTGWHAIIIVHMVYGLSASLSEFMTYCVVPTINDNPAKVSGVFGGHLHYDLNTNLSNGVPVILTDTDCMDVDAVHNPNTATKGTITEQCIDAITIDYSDGTIYTVRIGRGSDRTVTRT